MAEAANDKKRLRITRACDFCRRKKVKCYSSPGQTCTNCASYGMTCEFNDGTKKRGPPKGYIDALEKRIRQIETSLTSIQTIKTTNANNTNAKTTTTTTGSIHRLNHHKVDSALPVHKKIKSAKSDSVLYLGDLSSFQFFSNKIKLDGSQTFWRGQRLERFGKQVVLIGDEAAGSTQTLTDEIPDSFHVPKIQTMFPRKDIHHWIYSVTGVDSFTADRLLKIYFANVHPLLPVVNKTAFLKQYRDRCDSYPTPDLLNAMFGAAARFVECESRYRNQNQFQPPDMVWDVPKGWSDRFFEQSQAFITESSTLATLSKVQSIILIHNHSGNLDSKSSACWLLGGLAVRLAQGLGLYRDCAEWDIPESEKETRRRVWWALYVTDRFHSASLGRPISIRDEDIDVRYPDSSTTWKEIMDEPDENDEDGDDGPRFPSATYKPENASETVEIYQLFIQLIKLSEILGRILQGLYTPKAQRLSHEHGSDAIVTRLDHELTEWRFGFPTALQKSKFDDFDENTGYLAPVIATTLICYYGLLVLLHRPFIERTGSGKSKARATYSSFRIGSSAASRGINIASQMEPRDFLMFPYSFSLYPVLQCCLIHMYNTKNPDPKLASSAKIDLATGLALINKLKQMSHNAKKLHSLLEVLMENNDIDLNNTLVTANEQQLQSKSASTMNDIFVTNNSDGDHKSSDKSEIGDGYSKENTLIQNKNEQEGISSYSQNISTSSISNGNFSASLLFNPALEMASLTDIPVVSSSPSSNSATEAFSLRQFGFNTLDKQNQMDFALQDVNGLTRMNQMFPQDHISSSSSTATTLKQNITTTNSSASKLSLFDHQQYQQQQQTKASTSSPTSSSSSSPPANFPSLYNNTSQSPISATSTPTATSFLQLMSPIPVTTLEGSNQDPNSVFRNNPNNPFFGIPSSMDWSEWSEWNQRNQGISFI